MAELAVHFIINISVTVICFLFFAGAAFIIEWSIESVNRFYNTTFPGKHFPEPYIRTINVLAQFVFYVDVFGFIAMIGIHCVEFASEVSRQFHAMRLLHMSILDLPIIT